MARLRWRKNGTGTIAHVYRNGKFACVSAGAAEISNGVYVNILADFSIVHRKSFTKSTTLKSGQRYAVNWLRRHGYLI